MKPTYRQLVAALRRMEGERDAAIGINPQRSTINYVRGYSYQYTKGARFTAMTEKP